MSLGYFHRRLSLGRRAAGPTYIAELVDELAADADEHAQQQEHRARPEEAQAKG